MKKNTFLDPPDLLKGPMKVVPLFCPYVRTSVHPSVKLCPQKTILEFELATILTQKEFCHKILT